MDSNEEAHDEAECLTMDQIYRCTEVPLSVNTYVFNGHCRLGGIENE